jgi:hypothetical protein
MKIHTDKTSAKKSPVAANSLPERLSKGKSTFQFVDNRPEAIAQSKLQEEVTNSPHVQQLKTYQEMANNSPLVKQFKDYQAMADNFTSKIVQREENLKKETKQEKFKPIQKKENNKGLPGNLKSGIENVSGYSMDDVNVHYNSDKPAQLQAHAYAQGTDIHLAPGQEKHLPHEAWHVVQQKQGRVKPTMQLKGEVNINDDKGLETEADVKGAKALASVQLTDVSQQKKDETRHTEYPLRHIAPVAIQRKLTDDKWEYLSNESILKLKDLFEYRHGDGDLKKFNDVITEHQGQKKKTPLNALVSELVKSKNKEWKRVGHLLKMILAQFQESNDTGEPTGEKAWNDFADATKLIRSWVNNIPILNKPGIDEEAKFLLRPQLPKFKVPQDDHAKVLKIKEDQWQAASVAARRAGWLTGVGFLELKQALKAATSGTIKLQYNRDVIHEGLESNPSDVVKIGTVNIPEYATTEDALNNGLAYFSRYSFWKSGEYINRFGVILKHLDIGHKLVDIWENTSHRTIGKHVDKNVNFQFLALLSPKNNRLKIVGANGQVLGDGSYMYTIDPSFRVRYMPAANYVGEGGTAKNFFQFIPHSQLASLGAVTAAGNFEISEGKFKWIDNGSGHYRVAPLVNTSNTKAALLNMGYDIKGISFRSRGDADSDKTYKEGNEFLEGLPKGEKRPAMTKEIRALQEAMDQMHPQKGSSSL